MALDTQRICYSHEYIGPDRKSYETAYQHAHGVIGMNCWHCKEQLIWDGDEIINDDDWVNLMITNPSCPKCEAFVEVYLPSDEQPEEV
jgi:NAD-dependent SIR2 family protein deacetylase